MKGFILESETELIAVIMLTTNDKFYQNVRLAIAEHYVCDVNDVSIEMSDVEYNKDIYSKELNITAIEEGDECLRTYTLTAVCVYKDELDDSDLNTNKNNNVIDLSTCKKGDTLISRHGAKLKYVASTPWEHYTYLDHVVEYIVDRDGKSFGKYNYGTRTNNGFTFAKTRKPETDHDIVKVIAKVNKESHILSSKVLNKIIKYIEKKQKKNY